ncbi:MAG: DEAD/DEAH box helicase, partial [Candidatus Omnitrophica bacterium]|nr:DEAD/DEAH box helicase [Candidatus Omnitrophota bacterium]
ISADLGNNYPMHRLLQGDVGCGKTIIAALSIGLCAESGLQAAFLVPTEVLANQHFETIKKALRGLSFLKDTSGEQQIKVITSSLSKKEAESIYEGLSTDKIKVIIGTHALIQEKITFKKLGLVVIDEQHKFGVAQRSLLPQKGLVTPHCLVMSATPIPRSLALSLYGDLDLTVIEDLPKGRIKPQTMWLKEKKRKWVYDFLKKEIESGRQAYVVYPVIEESIDEDLKSLKIMHKSLVKEFTGLCVKEFHGKMKAQDKEKAIKDFKDGTIHILVCTTVIEVGLNIENATVMVVENPERFGLAQLHQLRGRIQRASLQPYFILLSKENLAQAAAKRLQVISEESSGFKIAEEDLLMRGPGDFFGNLQHGLPDLKIANPLRDLETLKQARHFAYNNIKKDPALKDKANECIRRHLENVYNCDIESLLS